MKIIKILILILSISFINGCGNDKKSADSKKSKNDTTEISEKPAGFKSAHQRDLEEAEKDSAENKNERKPTIIKFNK